jgi:UDP:flavonoid glycosyltransferase YjiC (YdhE family)
MSYNDQPVKPRVLVAPLDWGLGHATRCIPIIRELIHSGLQVILAGDGNTEKILRSEFPTLDFLPLEGYHITYGKNKIDLVGKILLQIPRIIISIEKENAWLEQVIEEYKIDAVISDNRYGLYNKNIYSVFITHQLQIKTGLAITDRIVQEINFKYINNFNVCWVPDVPGKTSLAGQLSHPKKKPAIPLEYMGWQSRFQKEIQTEEKNILVILSGPEPQRTLFEELILEQLSSYEKPVVFVRGLPGEDSHIETKENVVVFNHLCAADLEEQIAAASFIIARSGYSTVMDLIPLKKKTILVPTPGQTEQEYLAAHLLQNCFALCAEQSVFHLQNLIDVAASFPYKFPERPAENLLRQPISVMVNTIRQKQLDETKH